MGVQLPSEPITRKEKYLAKAAGQAVEIPAEPITREEAYLNAIAHGGGGGGGTGNYNDLSNQPQINGNTLIGNKTASDLGLVAAETGKGLSSNNYTDEDKAIVGGVTAALAGKQGALTAGKYIDIDANNEISVDPVVPNEAFTYLIEEPADYTLHVTKTVDGVVTFEETYVPTTWDAPIDVTLDNAIRIYTSLTGTMFYELVIASDAHDAGFKQSMQWFGRGSWTETFSTVDHSGEKLVIKSEMDTALATKADLTDLATAFSSSTAYTVGQYVSYDGNIYKCTSAHSAGAWVAGDFTLVTVGSELESKQNATDNSLQTTDKTVVGAVNELKSGLTNYQTQNDINLEVPNRKNILPMTVDGIKAANSGATWTGNTTTISGVTYTIETDDGGNVIGILANGKCTVVWHSVLYLAITDQIDSSIFLTGCPSGGNANTFEQQIYDAINDSVITRDYGDGDNNNPILSSLSEGLYVRIVVRYDYTANNLEFRPMIRPATITDPTFAPYIPSVESRIEAVESNLTGNWRQVTFADVFTFAQDVTASLGQNCVAWVRGDRVRIKLFVSGSITTTSTGYKTIGNVSNNYRPANNTIMPGFVNSRSDGTQMLASASYAINTNGNINLLYGDTATLGSVGSDWLGGNSILFEWSIK